MIIVSCQSLTKSHAANPVLTDVTFAVQEGERVGLIGPNGCGKSTLLQILAGARPHDEGQVAWKKGAKVGYLPQQPLEWERETVYDVLARGYRDVLACRAQIADLEAQMAATTENLEPLLARYAEAQERFQRAGGYEMEAHIQQVAAGLRIPQEQFGRPYATLSGGEKTKVGLASLLIERPDLLLLDEPTNHLDMQSIEWLESFLAGYAGACIIVSHDRYFLDRVVTRIIELEDGEAITYECSYSGYVKEKEERLLQQFAEFKEQQKKIKQMKETIRQLLEWGRQGDNPKFFRRAASMQKALDRMEMVKRPVMERRAASFDLQQADRSGREVLVTEGLSKRYGERQILNGVDGKLLYGEKVVLVGPNGAGKSTLFKLLLGQEQADGGTSTLGARVEVGYLAQQDAPESDRTVLQTFCDEAKVESGEGRSVLARYLFYGEDVFKPVNRLSGGEWTRLRLALLVWQKPNLLLLDEPTNHLDIAAREALEEALDEYPGTVLAISHDRYFINRIARRVWALAEGRLTAYLGNYDDYKARVAAPPPAPVAPPPAGPKPVRSRRPEATAERTRAQVEAAIAALEQQLAEMGARMEAETDVAALARLWAEREAHQARLDGLYEEWVALG